MGERTRRTADVGTDLKWAVTPNTVLDLTVNPDFGQTDVDRQVVNLTRFSVFFPERRQFFLENRGVFFTGNGERFERSSHAASVSMRPGSQFQFTRAPG